MFSKAKDPPDPLPKVEHGAGDLEKSPSIQVDTPTNDSSNDHVVPVTFRDLFRYSTKFELFLDFIGLTCAAAAGAAQVRCNMLSPLRSGRLTCYRPRHHSPS